MRLVRRFILLLFFSTSLSFSHPLPVDEVFKTSVKVLQFNQLSVTWQMAPDVSIYKKSLHFSVQPHGSIGLKPYFPPTNAAKMGPNGELEAAYKQSLRIPIMLENFSSDSFTLNISYQGCSNNGICYPPQEKSFSINLSPPYNEPIYPEKNQTSHLNTHFSNHPWFWTLGTYFMLGLLLAFTPCVLPMVPIVAGIVIGEHSNHRSRGLLLSLCYILGMALTYATAGVIVTRLGVNLQAFWQQPWLITIFAGVFVLMALALFDLYQIQMPSRFQNRLHLLSNQQKGGRFLGAFIMGVLATLILSPCVTPALLGALAYIIQTGDWVLGGSSLFLMGLGMGVPLLIIGLLGQQFLRRCGPWLQAVKATLGIFMLAISIVLLSRILPNWITQLLWGALFIGAGAAVFRVYAELHRPWQILKNIVGVLFVFYGIALWSQLFIVVHSGSLPILQLNQKKERKIQVINTPQELNLALIAAGNKPVLLEFSAQWCLACQVMEERVFPKKDVQKALEPFTQLRVDLTQITSEKKILMQRWDVIAPPVMLFIKNERELPDGRLIGEIDAQELIQTANKSSR